MHLPIFSGVIALIRGGQGPKSDGNGKVQGMLSQFQSSFGTLWCSDGVMVKATVSCVCGMSPREECVDDTIGEVAN